MRPADFIEPLRLPLSIHAHPHIAPIGPAQLPGVMAVQARAYGAGFLEAPEVLGNKLHATRGTCWGALVDAAALSGQEASAVGLGGLCAYAIAHAVPVGAPLVLNRSMATTTAPTMPDHDDWLYVHDIAVDPGYAGIGLAARLMQAVLEAGRRLDLTRAMLVAVQGAEPYWARHGFVAQAAPMPVQGFGDGAVWMSRAL